MNTSCSGVLVVLAFGCNGVDALRGIDFRWAWAGFLIAVEVLAGLPRFGAALLVELSNLDAFLPGWERTGLMLADVFLAGTFLVGGCGGAAGAGLDAV